MPAAPNANLATRIVLTDQREAGSGATAATTATTTTNINGTATMAGNKSALADAKTAGNHHHQKKGTSSSKSSNLNSNGTGGAADDATSAGSVSPAGLSPSSSETDLTKNMSATTAAATTLTGNGSPAAAAATATAIHSGARGKSLRERSKVPWSFHLSLSVVCGLQLFSGMWQYSTIESWTHSVLSSSSKVHGLLERYRDLCASAFQSSPSSSSSSSADSSGTIDAAAAGADVLPMSRSDYVRATVFAFLLASVAYVFVVAPFRAGLWTGPRSRKHKLHRYMGLAFMAQYALAWVEFCTSYAESGRSSYMPHVIALNGLVQSWSAFFSFKVLPELDDAGYYSDKAVLSRQFVHENSFFSLLVVFGSVYYRDHLRHQLKSSIGGQIIEYMFVFFPYVFVRPFFPVTRFSNAGSTHNGRSEKHKRFYEITTISVKIFFLWAKYFLGFFINFMIFLGIVTEDQWPTIHGMFLLNCGTVSLAVFLHTLRFRKILPAPFTFSVYLLQIYATFSAVPMVCNMFVSHPKLCAVALAGLLSNMTRSRKIHAVWCFASMLLLTQTNIEW